MPKQDVLFILSIDTEEEWQWDDEFPQGDCSVKNVERLPEFQRFCESLGIRPTYFVDYAVANDQNGSAILKEFAEKNVAEIGAHLHPWCNPPYFGKTNEAESHVINLPYEQVEQKLDSLTSIIINNIGVKPLSFRSGRWGVNARTLKMLASRGYTVDSSVYPFYQNDYFSCLGAPEIPYWPSFDDALSIGAQRNLMEIPITAGFNVKNFSVANAIHKTLSKAPFTWFKSIGLLWHTELLKKLYLSPELTDDKDMLSLAHTFMSRNSPVIHMYLHSSTLLDGITGLMNVENAFSLICERIANVLNALQKVYNVRFCTISEAKILLSNKPSQSNPIMSEQD